MKFECNANTPRFRFSEIREIYNHSQEKSTEALRETAHRLFPGRDPVMYENLMIRTGCGRAFLHEGEYTLPKWTIIAHPTWYGVMEDGTIYPYCDPSFYRRNTNEDSAAGGSHCDKDA
ncbi:MAG: hypothetical protein SOW84_05415 [Candidatus Faecousia sp.]|nr:hypothetical protein [Candidatus Faecousia sp.]